MMIGTNTLTPNQQQLIYWINERNAIREKKEAGLPKPWTDNTVMQETYFCNVNREDDKVTKWIRQNWTYPVSINVYDNLNNTESTKDSYTFSMIVARLFNLPATLDDMTQPIDGFVDLWLERAYEIIHERQKHKLNVWNGAYIVSTNGKKMKKGQYCIELLTNISEHLDIIDNCDTLKEAHTKLMTLHGLASFLAAQVVADLKNTTNHPLQHAEDWWDFSAFGPGSLRGLSWFWEKDIRPNTYENAIKEAHDLILLHLDTEITFDLCMQNLQNCFCEYDKFMRVTNGTGRSKRKYKGAK